MTPYAGFGPSAHSLSYSRTGGHGKSPLRSWNLADLGRYIKCLEEDQLPVEEKESITLAQQLLEMVMVRLRTAEGIDIKAFDVLSKKPFTEVYAELIKVLTGDNLGEITENKKRFMLTRAGWARLDSIVEQFAEMLL